MGLQRREAHLPDARGEAGIHRPSANAVPRGDPRGRLPEGGGPYRGLLRRGLLDHPRRGEQAGPEAPPEAHIGDRHLPHVQDMDPEPRRPPPQDAPDLQRLQVRDQGHPTPVQGERVPLERGPHRPRRLRGRRETGERRSRGLPLRLRRPGPQLPDIKAPRLRQVRRRGLQPRLRHVEPRREGQPDRHGPPARRELCGGLRAHLRGRRWKPGPRLHHLLRHGHGENPRRHHRPPRTTTA